MWKRVKLYLSSHREILSLVISLCALFSTFYQAYISREHNEKTFQPVVDVFLGDAHAAPHAAFIETIGVGPAVVRGIDIELFGKPLSLSYSYLDYVRDKSWKHEKRIPDIPLFYSTGYHNMTPFHIDRSTRWMLLGLRADGFRMLLRPSVTKPHTHA